jgi:hypothetical protein
LGAAAVLFLLLFDDTPLAVGPTFTTAESLAYDVVYETAGADAGSIGHLQTQTAGKRHAVLMGYLVNGEPEIRLVLARDNGREFFVENGQPGPAAADQHLTADVVLHPNAADAEVAVYGRLLDPVVGRVAITWSNGFQTDAILSEGSYLHFQSWSPVDGSPEPTAITAYDAAGHILSQLPLSPTIP